MVESGSPGKQAVVHREDCGRLGLHRNVEHRGNRRFTAREDRSDRQCAEADRDSSHRDREDGRDLRQVLGAFQRRDQLRHHLFQGK